MHLTPRLAGAALLALTLLGLTAAHLLTQRQHRPQVFTSGQVVQVVDGDTIKVQGVGSIRFLGIDAPETHDNSHGPKGCYGQAAKKRLAEIIPPGTPVQLVTEKRVRDKYGRVLAYVEANGVDVGEVLMQEGMVDFYRDKSGAVVPFARLDSYMGAWRDAERAVVGIHNPRCAP